jgi:hypothetical protein
MIYNSLHISLRGPTIGSTIIIQKNVFVSSNRPFSSVVLTNAELSREYKLVVMAEVAAR